MTPETGIGGTTKRIADRARSIIRLEIELARLELQRKLQQIGTGLGLGAGAAVLVFYAIGFLLAAAAAGLATTLPVWASLLIVAGAVLLIAAGLGIAARRSIQRSGPPVPQQAIEEARKTGDALRTNGHV
jgi:hypothetical protein